MSKNSILKVKTRIELSNYLSDLFSVGGFDAATLSGLNSLAAAATAVNGTSPVAASSALSMGGLAHHFSPYGTLPPPLLPYPHLAVSLDYYAQLKYSTFPHGHGIWPYELKFYNFSIVYVM